MRIDPANIAQIRRAEDGSYIEVSADAGTVAGDIRRIDPGLRVRLKITDVPRGQEFWAVYHVNHPGCPHNHKNADGRDSPDGSQYLVRSWKAYQNRSGTWEGLDQRAVDRIMQIGHSTYNFAGELENRRKERENRERANRSEQFGQLAEKAAHAIRKDLGVKYRGRIFKPRDLPPAA